MVARRGSVCDDCVVNSSGQKEWSIQAEKEIGMQEVVEGKERGWRSSCSVGEGTRSQLLGDNKCVVDCR